MSVLETWFPTAASSASNFYSWRLMPWWMSESRICRQRSLLRLLSLAHSERLDPAPLLNHYANEQVGLYRRRVRRLARRISEGTPVIEALEQTPEVLGPEAVLAIRFASQTGTLTQCYAELLAARDAAAELPQTRIQHAVIYSVISLLMLGGVLTFLAIFIFPMLIQIYNEMGLDTSGPMVFGWLVWLLEHAAANSHIYILLLVVLAFACLATPSRRIIQRLFSPRWTASAMRMRTSQILQLLAIALESGRPLSASLSTLAHFHFDDHIRHKLLLARNQIEQGIDEWTSLSDVQLLTVNESRALSGASSNESRIWTLRKLAEWKRTETLTQKDRSAALVQPVVTIVLASFVLVLCSAIFGFLSYLIWALA